MSYLDAPQTEMLATHCCVCGRPLCDAISVELGIGPECRDGYNEGITEEQRAMCNKLTWAASTFATRGMIEEVRRCAAAVRKIGLPNLANAIEGRFKEAERKVKIEVAQVGDKLRIVTPFRRGEKEEFKAAWRAIPGRRWDSALGCNVIPVEQKPKVMALLCRFFPGKYGRGDLGVFRVPGIDAESEAEQADVETTKGDTQ